MIIVRVLFDNLEGHVITSPAIPDKSLIIFLKIESTADIVLSFRETGEHQGCLSPSLVLQGSVFVYVQNIEVTFDIAEILFDIYRI